MEDVNKRKTNDYTIQLNDLSKNTSLSFMGMIIKNSVNFILSVMLARTLGPILLGRFQLGMTISQLLSSFTKMGFDQGLMRFIPIYYSNENKSGIKPLILFTFIFSFLISLILGVVLFVFSGWISVMFFHDPHMELILKWSVPYLITFTIVYLSSSLFKGFKRIDLSSLVEFVIVPISFLVFLFLLSNSIQKAYISLIVSQMLGIVVSSYLFKKKIYPFFKSNIFGSFSLKKYCSFSFPLLFIGLLYFMIFNTDLLLLGYFTNSFAIGVYSVVVKLALLASFLLNSLNSIFSPIISELVTKKSLDILERLLKNSTKWILFLGLDFMAIIILFNKDILMIFGAKYLVGSTALIILTIGQLVNIAAGPTGTILIMSGNQKFEVFNSIFICLLNLLLNVFLIPRYGIVGSALATASSITIINIFKLVQVYKVFRFHPYNKSYFKVLISFLAVFTLVFFEKYLIKNEYFILKLSLGFISIVIISIFVMRVLKFDEDDNLFINILKSKILKKLRI